MMLEERADIAPFGQPGEDLKGAFDSGDRDQQRHAGPADR